MERMILDMPGDLYNRLQRRASSSGKQPESVTLDILESALREEPPTPPSATRTTREILQTSRKLRPLSDSLRRRIIPGVTLDEVQTAIAKAGGPSLSEIIIAQRERRDA